MSNGGGQDTDMSNGDRDHTPIREYAAWIADHWPLVAGGTGVVAYALVWGAAALFYGQLDLEPAEVGLGYGELLQKALGLFVVVLLFPILVWMGALIGRKSQSVVWMGRAFLIVTMASASVVVVSLVFSNLPWSGFLGDLFPNISAIGFFGLASMPGIAVAIGLSNPKILVWGESGGKQRRLELAWPPVVVLWFVLGLLAQYWLTAYQIGADVREGRVRPGSFISALFPFGAGRVSVYGVLLDPAIDQRCLVYVRQVNNTAILWESKHHVVVRLSTSTGATLVVGGEQSRCPK